MILNKILNTNKNSVFTFKSKDITAKKGYHQIYLYVKSNDDIYCSCPEIYNGFSNGRHFTSWIIDRNNDNQKIVIKIPKKNKVINHNVISISKMLNYNYYDVKSNIFFSSKY